MKNILIPHLFIMSHSLLKISKVHISLFVSGSPFLSSTIYTELSTCTLKPLSETELHKLLVFFLVIDKAPNQIHQVILSQAITIPIAVTFWVIFPSPVIDFVFGLLFALRRETPNSFAWNKNTKINLVRP